MKQQEQKLVPLADCVVVRPEKAPEVSDGGILLPDSAKDVRSNRGSVIAVGPGKTRIHDGRLQIPIPPAVSVGDVVVFGQYGGHEVETNGEKLRVLREDDILAISV